MPDTPYLIPAADIAAMEGTPKTHFLNPNAQRKNISLGDMTGLTGMGFHIIEVAPGHETTEYHLHHFEDECVYILSGHATARIGDTEHPIGPGDFIGYRKGGLAHTILNTGDEVLRCIMVGQRLDHDVGDYPHQGKRIHRHFGLPWELTSHDDIEELAGTVGKK